MRLHATTLVAVLAACSSPTSPADDLAVATTVSPSSFRSGDQVTVLVTVTNRGKRPWAINLGACLHPFVVVNDRGEVVAPGSRICAANSSQKELQPGETYAFEHQWTGENRDPASSTITMIPAGTYTLRGHVLVGSQVLAGDAVTIHITQ